MKPLKVDEDQTGNLPPWPTMMIDGLPAWIWEIRQEKKAEALARLARERSAKPKATRKEDKPNAK